MRKSPDHVGKTFDRLTVIAKTDERRNRSVVWLCICECGAETTATTHDFTTRNKRSCGCLRTEVTSARGKAGLPRVDDPGYDMAHKRLRALRGPASATICVQCEEQAATWAYDGSDPYERIADAPFAGLAYSLNEACYRAMCYSCHRYYDNARARGSEAG